jgi:hypothetical protein
MIMDFEEIFNERELKKQKVFCIGDNKTGTTTMEAVLSNLGYQLPLQILQEHYTVEDYFLGNFEPLKQICSHYDAFQDLPFSQGVVYNVLDYMFPNSKFILTVRNSEKWFTSLVTFHLVGLLSEVGVYDINDFKESSFKDKNIYVTTDYLYNQFKKYVVFLKESEIVYDWSLLYNKEYRINLYETRNREIVQYFERRSDQLLVIDVTVEKDTSKIIDFLGISDIKPTIMPHMNKTNIQYLQELIDKGLMKG